MGAAYVRLPVRRRIVRVLLLGLLVAAACAAAASSSRAFAPTPTSPVYNGIPGALPPNFHYLYNDGYHGWPIAPAHSEHPVRGSFLDPRGIDDTGLSGYHFGIDISVDDHQRASGAPAGFSHRVYAVESGIARVSTNTPQPERDVRYRDESVAERSQ